MHVHIVLCCGVKRVLFTNNLSECWRCIINPYLFTKVNTSKPDGEPHLSTTWYGASLCSSVYTTTCRFSERAVLRFVTGPLIVIHQIYRVCSSYVTNRVAPARPKCLALH